MKWDVNNVNAEALDALQKWNRKYYRFSIQCGGHIQPGDGISVTLEAGCRKVIVYEEDLEANLDGGCLLIGDIIMEAIARWHADTSPKKFRVIIWDAADPPKAITGERVTDKMFWATVVAGSEEAAMERVKMAYWRDNRDQPRGGIKAYERGPA